MRYFALLSLVGVLVCTAWTQNSNDGIYFNSSTLYPAEISDQTERGLVAWPTNNCSAGDCFAVIKISIKLEDSHRAELNNLGIKLYDYIPNRAYLASWNSSSELQLPDYVTAVLTFEPDYKWPNIPIQLDEEESYHLMGIPFDGVSPILLAQALTEIGAVITYFDSTRIKYRVTPNLFSEILSCPLLKYTEAVPSMPVAEGGIGRSNLRIKGVNQGPGQGYDGKDIGIAIPDDGTIRHIDFAGRLVDNTTHNSGTGTHGEMTAGMAAGAGNIDPLAQGAAPGATIHLYNLGNYEHITNAVINFHQYGIAITSTSYGAGCSNDYNSTAVEIDKQVHENPVLLHCFSGGNHGLEPCFNPYSWLGPNESGRYYSTITGGRKSSKNVLAVGNNNWDDEIQESSSLGPTFDGRIKPDLCALGQSDFTTGVDNTYRQSSGTSAAAPNVAGALACLYQYYRESHNGQYPSSALIKAVALNTADDQGVAGPDFSYGWGRLNAAKALNSLQQSHYFQNTIEEGQQHSFQFVVPNGTQRLKVMLYWHDREGSLLASKALVNDLDVSLRTPSEEIKLPWIPNGTPHLDSLAQPARPGKDRLNNVEQVVIDAPQGGYYNVLVDGYQIPEGAQSYVIVYQTEVAPLKIVHPQNGSCFSPQEQTLITWDAIGNEEDFTIHYSINNGISWLLLENDIAGHRRSFLWNIPNASTSDLKIKISRGSDIAIADGQIVISALPVFDVIYLNATYAEVSWNSINGATGYVVYVLGEQYMEEVGTTTDLSYQLPATVGEEYWISIAPIFGTKRGRRANARIYQHYGCERFVNLDIQFDQYPGETSWQILDSQGATLERGGPYTGQNPHSFISLSICLPPGCYTLAMLDAYDDGLCCNNGDGYFRLTSINGTVLAEGSEFTDHDYTVFCPEETTNTTPLSISTEVIQNVDCFGGQNGMAQVVATGGSGQYSYQWSNGVLHSNVQNLSAGVYQVTVVDGETSQVQNVEITQPSQVNVLFSTQESICNDGRIDVTVIGGTQPYTFAWSDGGVGANRVGLAAGSYFLLVSDANGCTKSANIHVDGGENLQVHLVGSDPNCTNSIDGSITAVISGGQGNYHIQWSNGQHNVNTITGLSNGNYSVTVTSGSCQVQQSHTLIDPAVFSVLANQTTPSCHDAADAYIQVNVIGGAAPYIYQWSNGQNMSFINGLSAGVYLLTVTDNNGCATTRGYQIIAPDLLQVQADVSPAQVDVGGSVFLNVSGGSQPFTYQWAHGANEASLFNLAAGNYNVLITDANGCSVSTSVNIEQQDSNSSNLDYCEMQGASTAYEWIESITVNENNYYSGNDDGYGDYSDISITMMKNENQTISLLPGYTYTPYNEHWTIWIDYNHDGDFNEVNEKVYSNGLIAGLEIATFNVPTSALPGPTRMRIAMQYSQAAVLCSNLTYGEVEDYSVNIVANQNLITQFDPLIESTAVSMREPSWKAYPNPVTNWVILEGESLVEEPITIQVYNKMGQQLSTENRNETEGFFEYKVDMQNYPKGTYFIELKGQNWREIMKVVK